MLFALREGLRIECNNINKEVCMTEENKASENGMDERPIPSLYNPNVSANLCLLFSPIFSAILHAKNWQALGKPERAQQSYVWAIAYVAVIIAYSVGGAVSPEIAKIPGAAVYWPMLFAWYFTSGKAQITYVKEHCGSSYPRRSLIVPSLIALVVIIAVLMALGALVS